MPVLTDDVQDAAEDILVRHGGFPRQRRGVQSVARTEGLADRVEVPTSRPLKAGTALNAETLRAYQNASATILRKQKDLATKVGQGGMRRRPTNSSWKRVKTEAEVLTASFRVPRRKPGARAHSSLSGSHPPEW